MPCRDTSATLLVNPWKMSRIQPLHLCRVPAQGVPLILNPSIFITKFGESRIFNPETRPLPPRHRLDRDAQHPRVLPGIRVTGPHHGPARVPPFSCFPTRGCRFSAILSDFLGSKLTRNLVFLPCFYENLAPGFSLRHRCFSPKLPIHRPIRDGFGNLYRVDGPSPPGPAPKLSLDSGINYD